ncbi:hypothetical protein ZIOFF_012781 [Zingiber officinale]|uniref:Jacalin-type lectin domain-containing protein n=1 Tax=Zingiber officinale TaxID=94328 RepID=A0A8J5I8M9_ZINOF|nr:hypothetical protein ZIOFF_012781 [Zingiber officinale]
MVWPTLNFNVIFNNCFSGLRNSGGRHPRTDIKKLTTEMEKLRAERNDIRNKIEGAKQEGRLATAEAMQWHRDLDTLESQVAAIFEDFTRIIFRDNIKIGPWGGNGVSSFDTGGSVSRITRIRVQAGSIVDGLQVSYVNVDRNNVETPLVGGNGGTQHVIHLQIGESINSMLGIVCEFFGDTCISQLEFTTNFGMHYGPFGSINEGRRFNVPVINGRIVGFFGSSTRYLNEIGVYLASN